MRAAYTGHEALTFTDYLDLETGKTLHAEPGGVYDIAPASGRVVPEVPEPWFVRATHPTSGVWIGISRELADEVPAAAESAPEAAAEGGSAPEDEHGTEEG